jgi:hypothetical protein
MKRFAGLWHGNLVTVTVILLPVTDFACRWVSSGGYIKDAYNIQQSVVGGGKEEFSRMNIWDLNTKWQVPVRVGGGLCKDSRRVPDTSFCRFGRLLTDSLEWPAYINRCRSRSQTSTENFRAICGNRSSPSPIFESIISFKRCDVAGEKQTLKIVGNVLVTYVSMCVNCKAKTFRLYHL